MFIKSLELENFKRFKHLRIAFPGDITVIKGPNEQGKSTIVDAIIAAFFYDPKKSNEPIKNLKSWGSDAFYKISMSFEAEGENFLLKKDFEKKLSTLSNEETGEVIDDSKAIAKKLSHLGGYQGPDLFLNSSCVKQGELSFLDKKQTITEALQDIVSGGGLSISLNSIFKRIYNVKNELERGLDRGAAKNPGVILRLRNHLQDEAKLLSEKQRMFDEQKLARAHFEKLKINLAELENALNIKETLNKKFFQYFESLGKIEPLNKEYEKIQRTLELVKTLRKELEETQSNIDLLKRFEEFDVKNYSHLHRDIENIRSEIKNCENMTQDMRSKGLAVKEVINFKYVGLITVSAILGSMGLFLSSFFYIFYLAMVAVILWAIVSRSIFFRINRKKLDETLIKRQKELSDKIAELNKTLIYFGVKTIESAESGKEILYELKSKKNAIQSKIEGMLGEETEDLVKNRKREIEKRMAIEEEKMEGTSGFTLLSREEHEKLEQDIEALKKQQQIINKEISASEAKISNWNVSSEELNLIEEKTFLIKEELTNAERRSKILDILDESLREAQQKSFASIRKVMEEYIGKFLAEITENKYREVSIGPQMKLEVLSSEKGDYIIPEGNLSKGAIEQIYLVARFALISVLFPKDRILPRPLVILDDPFLSFDGVRKNRTKNILNELSHKFQIIILTCSNDYDGWGEVVDLEQV